VSGKGKALIIKRADVSARGERYSGVVTLTLVEEPDGWTYNVDGMPDERFLLTWRAKTPEGASRKLQDVYDPKDWQLTVTENG
jgi:hypothetical protein